MHTYSCVLLSAVRFTGSNLCYYKLVVKNWLKRDVTLYKLQNLYSWKKSRHGFGVMILV